MTHSPRRRRLLAGALLTAGAPWSAAQGAPTVLLAGRMGERALLMVDGQPRMLAVGQAAAGVRLLRWQGDEALVERDGRTALLRVGGSPAQLGGGAGAGPSGREIVISAGPGGHFMASGAINGKPVQFMVDTGATLLALSQGDAQRLGLDLTNARRGLSQTANGTVPVQLLSLTRVRVGEVEISNVDAVVMPAAMSHVLLGNSFLGRFQMRRENDVMRLELR